MAAWHPDRAWQRERSTASVRSAAVKIGCPAGTCPAGTADAAHLTAAPLPLSGIQHRRSPVLWVGTATTTTTATATTQGEHIRTDECKNRYTTTSDLTRRVRPGIGRDACVIARRCSMLTPRPRGGPSSGDRHHPDPLTGSPSLGDSKSQVRDMTGCRHVETNPRRHRACKASTRPRKGILERVIPTPFD